MSLVTLDYETAYCPASGYTLSKMTTEEYVRDPRFEVIMVGLKVDDGPKVWVPKPKVERILKRIDWDDTLLLCHHTQFDGFILSEHYGIFPKFYLCTMSMARVKGNLKASLAYLLEKYQTPTQKGHEVVNAAGKRFADFTPHELARYGSYCVDDVQGTWELFQELKRDFPMNELKSIDQTVRMFTRPLMVIDPEPLKQHLVFLKERRTEVLNTIPGDTEESKLKKLRSNPQFAKLLQENGVEHPPTKLNAKGKVTWAFAKTDPGLLHLLDNGTPEVQALVEARLGTKSSIEKTRCENFLGMSTRGPMPVYLSSSGALTTHRYAGGATEKDSGSQKQNLQNLNKFIKGTFTPHPLRMSLTAPPGYVMAVADSAQIEARLAVWFAGQENVVEAFAQGRDVYSEQASVIYGRTVDRKNNPDDKIPGFVGKTCVLGCGYGTGFVKMAGTFLQGALGGDPLQFDEAFADSLGISVHAFRGNKWKVERALEDPPATITLDEWFTQCAVSDYVVDVFRANNAQLVGMWGTCGRALDCIYEGIEMSFGVHNLVSVIPHVGLQLPEGVIIYYRDLQKDEEGYTYLGKKDGRVQRVRIYSSKCFENIIQCLAGMVIRRQMLAIGKRYPVVFQVHDEIPTLVPEREAQSGMDYILQAMQTAPPWAKGLPLAAEGSFGRCYGEAK
jgi:DNA polymerase